MLSLRERQSGLLPVVPFYAVGLDAGSLIAAAAVADVCVTINGGHSLAGEQPTFCFNSDYSGCGFDIILFIILLVNYICNLCLFGATNFAHLLNH